ncbi:SLAC1 anion channel family protein [Mucilaginibacter aquariorum]|uniref:SLAC1 anion channel family protein n=1 Tax=Mucilaginibacter aquariorum TaxID=2967225 RepID=A0ABT1SXN3_9SPHI|nr:SLAC1 anion channel family protein [Mucilaginibacter aquariorum]MCQ6957027.1 SLAC1 anion channel family protein [Mucilaginibacter aquariorum]
MNTAQIQFFKFLPVSLFGGVMGLSGLCFSWRIAVDLWLMNHFIPDVIGILAILSFVSLFSAYIIKVMKYPEIILEELKHPVSVCFFATFIVCLLLIPGVIMNEFPKIAAIIWCFGAVLMFIFAWYVLRRWIDHQQEPQNAVPAWVLPIVGTLDIPVVGLKLPINGIHQISEVAFGIGIIFSFLLLGIILGRLFFQSPLPETVQPTLLILTGPLALAFMVYYGLTGRVDLFAVVLFYFNIFLLILLASKIAHISVACPFRVTWWSVSFPMSAVTVTSLIFAQHHPDWFHQLLAVSLLAVTTMVIVYIFIKTIHQIITGSYYTPVNPIK